MDFPVGVLHRTPEGYLTGVLNVTGAGVFRYLDDGGKIVGRLRSVDEVRKATSSLNGKPVTLQHPGDDVTPDNVKTLSVGASGNDASFDGLNNTVTITIMDRDAVSSIDRGDVRAVSCGYSCNVVAKDGVWQGTPYQQMQSDIQYNHIALVLEGRAGDQVRFRVGDSADADKLFKTKKQEESKMKTMLIDGVQCQADEAVVAALQKASEERDEAVKKIADAKAAGDKVTAERDALKTENEKFKARDVNKEIADGVSAKVDLMKKAADFGCEVKATDSDESIRSAVILKAYDSADLKGKSADYIQAMFDMACDSLSKQKKQKDESAQKQLDAKGCGSGNGNGSPHDEMVKSVNGCFENKNKKKEA